MLVMKKIIASVFILIITQHVFATEHLATTAEEAMQFLKKASAGDKILLKNGSYKDARITFDNKNGTDDKPITFSAQTPGKVFFEGNSTLSFSGEHVIVTGFTWQNGGQDLGKKSVIEFKSGADKVAQHCTLEDCAIINYNNADKNIDNKWISLYGEYNTVTHCLLKDKSNLGATLTVWLTPGKEAHHTISYNYFNGRQNGPNADNGLESIRIGDSKTSFEQSHCVVALNRFEACDGEIEIISNKSFHNSYLHNTFYNSDGGLTLRHGNECLCDGNYFDGAGKPLAYGIRFIGEGHVAINNYFANLNAAPKQNFRAPVTLVTGLVNTPINGYFQVKRAVVADNIFVNCATPNIRVGATPKRDGATLAPDSVTIINNLIYDDANTSGNVYEEELKPTHVKIEGNKVVGQNLIANTKGFQLLSPKKVKRQDAKWIKDDKGHLLASSSAKASLMINTTAGASYVMPSIKEAIQGEKYSNLSPGQVGPRWFNK
jgi:poly(beta-D-mannuronate) lyase